VHRITESSFYVIRTQFVYEIMRKLTFMGKYPNYIFTPHNFTSSFSTGDTAYEYVRDHNYEPSYYFERCERTLADSLKLSLFRLNIDCEAMRLDDMTDHLKPPMYKHCPLFKLKYMCRKCEGKEIWTTRDRVAIHYTLVPLETVFEQMMKKNNGELGKEGVFD
jgi:hypothetical protein